MRVRPAQTTDLSRITEITVSCLVDDPTFDYQWQHRREYPDDNVFFWHLHLKELLYKPSTRVFVVELEDHDLPGLDDPFSDDEQARSSPRGEHQPSEKASSTAIEIATSGTTAAVATAHAHSPHTVVAYGIWERIGTSRTARRWSREKSTWINKLDRVNTSMENWLLRCKGISRRDGSDSREAALEEASDQVRREFFEEKGITEWWSMELVVTDRRFRRRGAATSLVEIGCRWADEEGVWVGVEASPMGELVYQSMGFVRAATKTVRVEGEDEELTFAIMQKEPRVPRKEAC